MPIDFYYIGFSAPCRAALLTARAVGVELNLITVDLLGGEQFKPEFLAMNVQHTVPLIIDEGFTLWESRAICSYLATKYGEDDSLYPTDPVARAKVDRILYFDIGVLVGTFVKYSAPVFFEGQEPDQEKLDKVYEVLGWLDGWMEGQDWAAGDHMTIADHSLVAGISTVEAAGLDVEQFPNISAWLERCKKEMDGYEELNQIGATEWGDYFKSKIPK